MPLPNPNKGEERDEFISRCIGNEVMKKEYPDQSQRTAVCFSQWRKGGTEGVRGGDREGPRDRPINNEDIKDVRETEAGTIRIRIEDPKKYIRFRIKDLGKGIKAVIGFKKTGGSGVQAYIFDKENWDVDRAKAWVERHKLHDSVDFPIPTLSQIYDLRKEMALLLSRTRKFSLGEIAKWTSLSKSCIHILQKQHNLK